jgi:hypothetical protein
MKHLLFFSLSFIAFPLFAQEETGLPGDHFNLNGALELFENSNSPEDFEKKLNTESSQVNNLDLNQDGDIDYVKVIAKQEGDLHIFVLQVAVSESENQDIAVFELEKTGDETAVLQLIGDEEIFGEEIIVEAAGDDYMEESKDRKGGGPSPTNYKVPYIVVNVWSWPFVKFVYAPVYRPWISPYRWRVYPTWYRPWRPLAWNSWHPIRHRHIHTVRVTTTHRVVRAHKVYTPVRTKSKTVSVRTTSARNNYKVTRTKTTVQGPRGGKHTKTTTKVKTPKTTVKKTRTSHKRGG